MEGRSITASAVLVVALLTTACTAGPGEQGSPVGDRGASERPDRSRPALAVARTSTSSARVPPLVACVSHSSRSELTDVPKLLWVVLDVTRPVRLDGLDIAGQTRIERRTAWIGPDAGPDAPRAAVVIGAEPDSDRAEYDVEPIGDRERRDVTGVVRSWRARTALRDDQRLARGRHVLFVRVETGHLASFKGLALGWREPDGARRSTPIGGLKFVVRCGV